MAAQPVTDDEHLNTLLSKDSTLYTSNILNMSNDGCNKLQILGPAKTLKTVLPGSDKLPEDDIFMDDEDSVLEIICDITQINKLSGPSLTSLF